MYKIFLFILLSIGLFNIVSCKRTLDVVGDYDLNTDQTKAYLKFIHASPNFRKVWNARDSFDILVNSKKINSSILTYNGIFPFAVNASTNSITATYAAVPAGQVEIKLSNPGANSTDSFNIVTISKTLIGGSFYTMMLTDSFKLDKDSSKIFINDAVPVPALPGNYNLRFIHAGVSTADSVDVFSYARNANIISGLRPGGISGFVSLGYNASVADTIFIRKKGTTAVPGAILVKYPLNGVNLGTGSLDGRSFTLYYKGDGTVATGSKALSVASYINF